MPHRTSRVGAFATGVVLLSALGSGAQEPADAEKARLAESILRQAEAASRRQLDGPFRQSAQRGLATLPLEELAAREARGAARGIGPLALGDATSQLLYTPVPPCRVVDTRVAGGALAAGSARDIRVTGTGLQGQGGNPAGCGVPHGPATSAIINFVAVNPVGPGNLRAWAYSEPAMPPPNASIINYPFGLTLANGIAVPLCDITQTNCSFDLKVQADANVVVDVVGYFERFPKEIVRSFTVAITGGAQTTIGSTCTHVNGMEVTIAAPAAGTVIVRGIVPLLIGHTAGSGDDLMLAGITQSATSCGFQGGVASRVLIANALPTSVYQDTIPVMATFQVAAGTYTFHVNAVMADGGTGNDAVLSQQAALEATFYPN
jgi:hypothetical protein